MAISPAPKQKNEPSKPVQIDAKTERQIKEVINRGGSTKQADAESIQLAKLVNVSLTIEEIEAIAELRQCRPRDGRSKKKVPVSQHAWLVEAAQEKIERERKKYGISK
ncbi:hypothetical protein [Dyadobacter sp. CY323]|uniref:hypothetical protein n=1 Tax=Dyadobacter sp. CY323 TaxID=2907302 RepID=UPI001F19EB55|nr:hypothetical protein [Dyadobacter sp. CY323]MCE6993184.1 hypothetical protein [Dyadobacter sp. CY323]